MSKIGEQYSGLHGKYTVRNHIHDGGMGSVWEATDDRGNTVVIKFPATMVNGVLMPPDYHANILQKLRIEANILKTFADSTPLIVKYVDESNEPNNYFLVIEKIVGKTLKKAVSMPGISESDVIKFSLDILNSLNFLHKNKIAYRDLKPLNVMVNQKNRCILIDFGTAKQGVYDGSNQEKTDQTKIVLDGWSCPHQMMGTASTKCDLYALGRLMFYMASGITPKKYSSTDGSMSRALHDVRSGTSKNLSDLIDQLVDPNHRTWHNAADVYKKIASLNITRSSRIIAAPQKPAIHSPRGVRSPQKPAIHSPREVQKSAIYSSQAVPTIHTSPTLPLGFQIGIQTGVHIVLDGIDYPVYPHPGSFIGRFHDVDNCSNCRNSGGKENILIGWPCPPECQCIYNPAHLLDKHHMRIWKDQHGMIQFVVNDDQTRAAVYKNGRWIPVPHSMPQILNIGDRAALLYNEKKGPFQEFKVMEDGT